jgi:hypothetical protein
MLGQLDQGTITGVVQDSNGAVIANAAVTLTNVDVGQVLKMKTDGAGMYVFSPIKIGNYEVTAGAPNFSTTTQTNLHLSIQQRLNVVITLKPGSVTETVTVTTEVPLMQTQESSVGQTVSAEVINQVPLNGRNWIYIAQLAAGVALPQGSRGANGGDFNANGQRAEENNFILDGVDNNANVVDFFNGASYVVNPPPDALAEFKVQTSSYSAEFGHSAGAVINASIKSGSNKLHGDLWEYVRNTALNIHQWTDPVGSKVATYHQNQFGATLGGPVIKNKLFLFGDVQNTRVSQQTSSSFNVPTANERVGDFHELLSESLMGSGNATKLYYQDPTGVKPPALLSNGCMAVAGTCTAKDNASIPALNTVALKMLSLYPLPGGTADAAAGHLYNNYSANYPSNDNTFTWDARVDWTIDDKNTAYSRFSYTNERWNNTPPLGNILDGGGFGDGSNLAMGENFMLSETHIFSQSLTNEARIGYNYLHTGFTHPNASDTTLSTAAGGDTFAADQGFGGIPGGTLNGGLPNSWFDGANSPHGFGAPTWAATDEHENVYQVIDNITKIAGSHTLKAGVNYQNMRFATLQPYYSRGEYDFNNRGTSLALASNTGYGVADFLLDQVKWAALSNSVIDGDQRANFSVYFQDDWRVNRNLTFNLGVRYEYFQPYKEVSGQQASFNFLSTPTLNLETGRGSVVGQYLIPSQSKILAQSFFTKYGFDAALANDGIAVVYDDDPRLQQAQKYNFAPRLGAAWSYDPKTVVRSGFGIFYGGLESLGYWANLGENYPFQFNGSWDSPSCTTGMNYCPQLMDDSSAQVNIEKGFTTILANGFASTVTGLNMRGTDAKAKTPYTVDWNLAVERGIIKDFVGTASYVGNTSRHLMENIDVNQPLALEAHGANTRPANPMPNQAGSSYTSYNGMSNYHALQTKLEKRMSNGYNLLATYTWGKSLDDAVTPLGSTGDSNFRQENLIPLNKEYSHSSFDVRQRFTFNALYELPFGKGRAYLNQGMLLDEIVGGWSLNALFTAQTGQYFTIGTTGLSTPAGFDHGPFAYQVASEFSTGGTGANCASKVKTRANWYNPCAYANPWDAGDPYATISGSSNLVTATSKLASSGLPANSHYIPTSAADPYLPAGDTTPVYVQSSALVMGYAGGKRNIAVGPGLERVNMSIFKNFNVFREQKLTFRTDVFNLFNTPSLGQPSTADLSSNGGKITGSRGLQKNSPDSRFFQLSLKYAF